MQADTAICVGCNGVALPATAADGHTGAVKSPTLLHANETAGKTWPLVCGFGRFVAQAMLTGDTETLVDVGRTIVACETLNAAAIIRDSSIGAIAAVHAWPRRTLVDSDGAEIELPATAAGGWVERPVGTPVHAKAIAPTTMVSLAATYAV